MHGTYSIYISYLFIPFENQAKHNNLDTRYPTKVNPNFNWVWNFTNLDLYSSHSGFHCLSSLGYIESGLGWANSWVEPPELHHLIFLTSHTPQIKNRAKIADIHARKKTERSKLVVHWKFEPSSTEKIFSRILDF